MQKVRAKDKSESERALPTSHWAFVGSMSFLFGSAFALTKILIKIFFAPSHECKFVVKRTLKKEKNSYSSELKWKLNRLHKHRSVKT